MERKEPVTHGEVQALLEPLKTSAHRIEKLLIELMSASWSLPEEDVLSDKNWVKAEHSNVNNKAKPAATNDNNFRVEKFVELEPNIDSVHPSPAAYFGLEVNGVYELLPDAVLAVSNGLESTTNDEEPMPPASVQTKGCTNAEPNPPTLDGTPSVNFKVSTSDISSIALLESRIEPESTPATVSTAGAMNGTQSLTHRSCYDCVQLPHVCDLVAHKNIEAAFRSKSFKGFQNICLDQLVYQVQRFSLWWRAIKEPERRGCISKLVKSDLFELAVVLAVVMNSGLGAWHANWEMQNIGKTQEPFFETAELVFFVFFLIEISLRLAAHRFYFFLGREMKWNMFDLIVVSASVSDILLKQGRGSSNKGFMRLLRLLKLTRIFRSMRSFRFVKSLSNLLESLGNSFTSLFWGFIMLFFVMYLFSLLFMQALTNYLCSHLNVDPELREEIMSRFGSLDVTLLSLYMSVTGGVDWNECFSIISRAGWIHALLFVVFTFVIIFALFNIITGSVVDHAMSSAKSDRTDLILNQRKQCKAQMKQFMDICQAIDVNKDGKITWDEFEQRMNSPVMLAWMASMGIEMEDVELFFATVSARAEHAGTGFEGELTIAQFVEGCMHMKGSATAIDMQRQLFEMHILQRTMKDLEAVFSKRFTRLEDEVHQCLHAHTNPVYELQQ